MSYAAPYPNCSTQYSKSFPLLTTRTHTPNQPGCTNPPLSPHSSATMGAVPDTLPPVVLADAGTHPIPPVVLADANPPLSPPFPLQGGRLGWGWNLPSSSRCPRGCGDPSHPLLSSRMRCPRGCGDPSPSPCPHDPLVPWPPSLEDAPLLSAHVLTVIPSPVIPTEAGTHPFPHPICAIPNPLI